MGGLRLHLAHGLYCPHLASHSTRLQWHFPSLGNSRRQDELHSTHTSPPCPCSIRWSPFPVAPSPHHLCHTAHTYFLNNTCNLQALLGRLTDANFTTYPTPIVFLCICQLKALYNNIKQHCTFSPIHVNLLANQIIAISDDHFCGSRWQTSR